jgi:hypothetical protein
MQGGDAKEAEFTCEVHDAYKWGFINGLQHLNWLKNRVITGYRKY